MLEYSFSNFFNASKPLIIEGGNVFNEIKSSSIRKEFIAPTLKEFYKQFTKVFPAAELHFQGIVALGSSAPESTKKEPGDIDLALSEDSFKNIDDWNLEQEDINKLVSVFEKRARTSSREQLIKRAIIVLIADKLAEVSTNIATDSKSSSSGTLFCQFPQFNSNGKIVKDEEGNEKRVQIDINIGDVDWLKFAYYSTSYEGNVKGLHRTQLLVALFSHKGYTFSHNYGVKNKVTQEIVANKPQKAIQLLNMLYGLRLNEKVLENYHSLMNALKKGLNKEDLHSVFDSYLRILDSTRADIPDDLQEYWKENQQRLGLKGKFLPSDSNLFKYKVL